MDRPTVGSVQILRGNALALALADESVDLIVTSPPYFGLRSYQDGGEHYAGQIGDEPTPAEFVDALIAATAEMVRVLKPSGSIWVNLGDKYAASGGGGAGSSDGTTGRGPRPARRLSGIPAKSLMGIPWRYAIRCIDDLGLILRAEVIWCLSGGARVYARTATGDRPIMLRDLVRAYRPEDVHLWNGERWTQVLGWNKTPDDDGALEIELRTGERIGCTPGHKWPTQRGVIRADEIRVGDVIETTRLPEPEQPRTPALLPDEDIGWLVGLYIAEGSRSGRMVQIAGHLNETERHARLARIAKALDGQCNVYQTSENGSTCNLSGSVILGVLDRYISPGTAKTKRLRAAAWQRSDTFLRAVVEGYLSGDGHFDAKNDRWRLGFTANDEWAADLRTIAARLGSKLSLRRAVHTSRGRQFPGWRGEWRWTRSAHHNAKQDGEVVAIRASRARDFYDVGVADEPHLFALASGVLTHNSKPNGLPESVTDRVRRSHEQWFHFTKEPRYFSAVDEIREAHLAPNRSGTNPKHESAPFAAGIPAHTSLSTTQPNPLGKLPSSVWEIEHDSENVVRHVLSAISTGSLTIEEGERILTGVRQWTGSNGSGARSTRAVNAGSGLAASPLPDTANSGSTDAASSGTESPTHSLTEPYPRVVCNSTTYAEPGHVCDLNISSPSASATTSCADPRPSQPSTPPRPTAETATSSATSTPTDRQTEAVCAESACEPRTDAPTGERRAAPQPDVPGSVWTVATEPLHVPESLGIDHFAAFPTEFPRRIIQGWSPRGICVECGEGRRPTSERDPIDPRFLASNKRGDGRGNVEVRGVSQSSILRTGLQAGQSPATRITGEACACPEPTAPTRPAVVLDPFGGTGTTALVAKALGRHGISNDMSADYCRLAGWRTTDPKQLAKAARRPFVPPAEQTEGQLDLLEGIA